MIGSTGRLVLFIIALGSLTMAGGTAMAKGVNINGNHSAGEIQATCAKVGGSFSEHEDGKGYGCEKRCGNKGGNCVVACTTAPPPARNCNGVVPNAVHTKPPISGTTRTEQILMAFETKDYQPAVKP